MPGQKPTLKPGEYLPSVVVNYTAKDAPGHKDFKGKYTVELGGEFKNDSGLSKHTRRYVRVNGYELDMYAMVREKERFKQDRKILRDEDELRQRAVEWYIFRVLEPEKKAQRDEEAARQREIAMDSADNWRIVVKGIEATIEPIGITITMSSDLPQYAKVRKKRIAILTRLMKLAKEHGL